MGIFGAWAGVARQKILCVGRGWEVQGWTLRLGENEDTIPQYDSSRVQTRRVSSRFQHFLTNRMLRRHRKRAGLLT